MAAPTLFNQAADTVVTTGTLACTMPTHATDDILVAAVFFWGPSPGTVPDDIPVPSGWAAMHTQIAVDGSTTRGKICLFWKRATSGAETVTFTRGANWDTGTDTCYYSRLFSIRGCITTGNPWDEVDPTACLTASNGAFDAITVSGTERMVVQFGVRTNAAGTPFPAAPSGWTAGTADNNTGGSDGSSQTYRKDNTAVSTSADATTLVWSGSGGYAFIGVSFKPPGGDIIVSASPGVMTLSAGVNAPVYGGTVAASPGVMLLAAGAHVPGVSATVEASPGPMILSGGANTPTYTGTVEASPGAMVLTAGTNTPIYSGTVQASPGQMMMLSGGGDVEVVSATTVEATPGILTFVGGVNTPNYSGSVQSSPGVMTLSGGANTPAYGGTVEASPAPMLLDGGVHTLDGVDPPPPAGALAHAGDPPTVGART